MGAGQRAHANWLRAQGRHTRHMLSTHLMAVHAKPKVTAEPIDLGWICGSAISSSTKILHPDCCVKLGPSEPQLLHLSRRMITGGLRDHHSTEVLDTKQMLSEDWPPSSWLGCAVAAV